MLTGRSMALPSLVQKSPLLGSGLKSGGLRSPSWAARVNTGFATHPPSIHVAPISATTSPSQHECMRPPGLEFDRSVSVPIWCILQVCTIITHRSVASSIVIFLRPHWTRRWAAERPAIPAPIITTFGSGFDGSSMHGSS